MGSGGSAGESGWVVCAPNPRAVVRTVLKGGEVQGGVLGNALGW